MSVVVNDFLNAYKVGHKTAYYSNTYDGRSDGIEEKEQSKMDIDNLINELSNLEGEEYCDSCTI
jgi:hypothetical protein